MSETPRDNAEGLRSFLAESDVLCPSCRYNLRGLKSNSCPECNQRLVLRVGLAEPRMHAFIAAVIGLAAGAGFSGSWLVMMLLYGWPDRDEWSAFWVLVGGLALSALFLGLLIAKRGWWGRQSVVFCVTSVVLAWLFPVVLFVLFIASVR